MFRLEFLKQKLSTILHEMLQIYMKGNLTFSLEKFNLVVALYSFSFNEYCNQYNQYISDKWVSTEFWIT